MHDFGKYSHKFQKYIHDETGLFNPDLDDEESTPNGSKVDHSTAGAQWVYRELRKFGAAQGIGRIVRTNAGFMHSITPRRRFD